MQGEVKWLHAKWMLTKLRLTNMEKIGILESCNSEILETGAHSGIAGLPDYRITGFQLALSNKINHRNLRHNPHPTRIAEKSEAAIDIQLLRTVFIKTSPLLI